MIECDRGTPVNQDTVKAIIFDFDGTIADSFDAVVTIANQLATEFGYPAVSPDDVKRLQNLSSREIVKQAGISIWQLPFLLMRFRKELNQEIGELQPIQGIPEALKELKQRGHQLGIVTSNSQQNVMAFLAAHDMSNLFDFVGTGLNIFGKGKIIQRIVRRHHLDPAIVLYVGDETRDVEAARKIRIRVIAVGWGFSSHAVLATHRPDRLIECPQELIDAVESM